MGVSGAGKSTVGEALATRLGLPFEDGDALHPPVNIAKMASGQPLTDADRRPWLDRVAEAMEGWRRAGTGGVIACSALKRAYRDRLAAPDVTFVYLAETPETIRARLARRRGHFMPETLIDSQFAALEPPGLDEQAVVSPPGTSVEARCEGIVQALGRSVGARSNGGALTWRSAGRLKMTAAPRLPKITR
jgi:carbohydrate kinase (thermoresistant glucokinase family)